MIKQVFITGTDTNVGKTTISIILLNQAKKQGFNTAGYKPIATGIIKNNNKVFNYDAYLLKKNSTVSLNYHEVNPFLYNKTIPPSFIINQKNNFNFKKISYGLKNLQKKSNWIIIEGIGGWHTPLSQKKAMSDWVKLENIPVILVVGIKLGCMNHAILTHQAIMCAGLTFHGWYANCIEKEENYLDYIYTIQEYINIPCLGVIPYIENMNLNVIKNINIITLK